MLAVVNGAALGRLAVIPVYLHQIHAQNQKDVLVPDDQFVSYYYQKFVAAMKGRNKNALINGAKKNKLGQQAKAGLFVINKPVLEYKGGGTL